MIFRQALVAFLFGISIASATPSAYTRVTEKVLGSSREAFAVMRFEEINRGSYYNWEEKTYLDEYKKGGKGRELVKSTLLTHTKVSFPNADTRLPLKRELVSQDSTLKLGTVITNYPANPGWKWPSDQVKELKILKTGGVFLDEFGHIFSKEELQKEFGEMEFTEMKVRSVTTAGRGLFVEITSGFPATADHSEQQVRQLFVPEKMAGHIWDHRHKAKIYLMAGEFPDLANAQTYADELNAKAKRKKIWTPFDIWTKRKNGYDSYRVVIAMSDEALQGEYHLKWEEKLEVRLTPIGGKSLRRKQALASE